MSEPKSRSRRRSLRLGLALVLAAGLYATHGWTLPAWGQWLDASEPPRPADYALVLSGGADTRPFVAAGLYKAGYVRGVLVSRLRSTPDDADGIVPPEGELVRAVLVARGVPPERVTALPGAVNSTAEEAAALAQFLDDHPGATIAVVTNDFHTRRAGAIFRRALGPRAAQVYLAAAPTDGFSAADWWTTETGFVTYLGETAKAAYFSAPD